LITGGAGFIGSSLIKHILKISEFKVVNVDKLSYAGNLESLIDIADNKNYNFIQADIANYDLIQDIVLDEAPNIIMHLAAESHVDRSIENPLDFINSNIIGTYNLVESSKKTYR
jgi:dTDP-glucose 4,6-dehydratase